MEKRSKLRIRSDREKLSMCLLPLLKLILFAYVPMIGLVVAFENYKPKDMFLSEWIGFENFKVVFGNPELFNLLRNAVVLNILFVFFGTVVGLILALVMFEMTKRIAIKTAQSVFFMPYFISWPIVAMMCVSLFGINGVVTQFFGLFGKEFDFYSMPNIWPGILTGVYVWKSAGMTCITYYAVLLNTDPEIYEAASIDGANMFQRMWHISLANLKMMVLVGIIMSCGNIIRMDFSMNYFIIGGNTPLYPTVDVLESYMYRALLSVSKYGNVIAMGLFQGVVGLVLSIVANYIIKRFDKDASIF